MKEIHNFIEGEIIMRTTRSELYGRKSTLKGDIICIIAGSAIGAFIVASFIASVLWVM